MTINTLTFNQRMQIFNAITPGGLLWEWLTADPSRDHHNYETIAARLTEKLGFEVTVNNLTAMCKEVPEKDLFTHVYKTRHGLGFWPKTKTPSVAIQGIEAAIADLTDRVRALEDAVTRPRAIAR